MAESDSSNTLLSGLEGQRVLVTAGAGGIGLAISELLLRQGARVAICDVSDTLLDGFRGRFSKAHVVKADVSDEGDVDRLFDGVKTALGGLDALVNNAGIAGPTGAIEDIDPAEWRRCVDIGLTGQFLCARRAVPLIKAAGGGSIISMSSSAGRHGYAFRTPYSSAKFGVIGLSQSLAKELGPHNIRVNAILPGIVAGPRMEGVICSRAEQVGIAYDDMKAQYLSRVSLRRMVSQNDIAAMIAFLLSDAGGSISGQSIGVDGNVETL
jgi:NAD(P)-dependent dehydrogenase (short-subunit alcohol dehydrogenase family)